MMNPQVIPSQIRVKTLFRGEKTLLLLSLTGFILAALMALYIALFGAEVLPEGNVESAFSFNAAIAMFVLSVAAILPLTGWTERKRRRFRFVFTAGIAFCYGAETIQHLRGINPRFTEAGNVWDRITGMLFGLDSLLLIVLTVMLAVPFWRKSKSKSRTEGGPLLALSIRYAFLSVFLAYAGGIWMIIEESRYTGDSGNLIFLHGLGFHALQSLPLIGWLLTSAGSNIRHGRLVVHTGGLAWLLAILALTFQTALGRTVLELTALPLTALAMLQIWGCAAVFAAAVLYSSRQEYPAASGKQI
ncbi:hypothetical protein [Paenibacillus lutrae]|uniref:Uncharacterized protein n=1 Tax=Paenibacillus lutrae TaxID=2078573 RepID=A0A7X3FK92_9BACL|nr:hypothetical protein [Paenibacillus lutrae]MVP01185.1 hypothetical protein [Paenibacillus lutrae]